MQKLAVVSLLSSSILAGPAFAQDAQKPASGTTTMLDKIIITGRDDRSISTVAQSVQVIDRAEVETAVGQNENASDLVARLVPGYAPRNQTISGASETFRGRSVLIMVDGVPRNTPWRRAP